MHGNCTISDPDAPINNPPSTTSHVCSAGWTPYWYGCYRLETATRTFDGAQTFCESVGGSLMSIHSEAENSAAHVLAQGSLPVWIGMNKV